jgi:general secretion pathway protein G
VSLRKVRTNVKRAAFTLMEILVVVAIIVLLAGLGTWGYMGYLERARLNRAKADCVHISEAVETYNLTNGNYPGSLQELTQQTGGMKAFLEPKDIIDPWGKQYSFDPNSQTATGRVKVFTVYNGQEISNHQ